MWFFPHYLDLISYFPPVRLSLCNKTNRWIWCEKSVTSQFLKTRTTTGNWASSESDIVCEGIVFSVSTGFKSSQICFGRDPRLLVSLIAFPTTLHDYQIMCSRIQTNALQFIPFLITMYHLNLQLFLANVLPLLPFPFTLSSVLSQLDGNLHLLIVS